MSKLNIVNPQLLKIPEYFELVTISGDEYRQLYRLYYQFELVKKTVAFLNSEFNQVIDNNREGLDNE